MWLASEMAAFAHVAELKSFTAAARVLGVPKVAVSRAIVSLERRLGTRLLTRTTRRVALTNAGLLLRPHCQRLVAEVDAVRMRFAPATDSVRSLRLIVDPGYGRLLVAPLVPRFLERYGDFQLQVALVNSMPEEANKDWDLLICNAAPERPDLICTALGNPSLLLCATPLYLARQGRPRAPTDLSLHSVLRVVATTEAEGGASLRLRRDCEEQQIRLKPALQVNDPALVHSSTVASLGIGVLPEFMCRQGLAMGKLERVLPDWSLAAPLRLQAVYPTELAGSAAIRLFIEFLLANMAPVLGGDAG
ncbi:MAG TPA: LysR family transcriptional regulator [Steroidobacteraceae bacterium]|jgi:DNA-binding transcriptional LysR family regulator|nr:LysR family transcriptional regulator [Steroidobacteraceae bacterium]